MCPSKEAWETFFVQCGLDMEFTDHRQNEDGCRHKHYFVRVGQLKLPVVTKAEQTREKKRPTFGLNTLGNVMKECNSKYRRVPTTRGLTGAATAVATELLTECDLALAAAHAAGDDAEYFDSDDEDSDFEPAGEDSDVDSGEEETNNDEFIQEKEESKLPFTTINYEDSEFPMFAHLGVKTQLHLDGLIRDLRRYYRDDGDTIPFQYGNSSKGLYVKSKILNADKRQELESELKSLTAWIDAIEELKELVFTDEKHMKQVLKDAKKADDSFRAKVGKTGRPLWMRFEHEILNVFDAIASAYHGGDLNGKAVKALMDHAIVIFGRAKLLFREFIDDLPEEDRSARKKESDDICDVYSTLLVSLGKVFSILRTGWGEVTDTHINDFKKHLVQCELMWRKLGLNWTPKWHSLLEHALECLRLTGGFMQMQEDGLELYHQTGHRDMKRFESVREYQKMANSLVKAEHRRNNLKLQKQQEKVVSNTKRKMKAEGSSKKQDRKAAKKQEKEAIREDNLDATFSPAKVESGYNKQRADLMERLEKNINT